MEPEELYAHLHVTRVATTQSSGIGGMQKLRRLYHDPMLDRERQSDVLQETLINVISGWMVQSYVGSYGPISAPVGACATAALSVAEAMDMLATGRADFVVTGGCDDYNEEGAVGFSDMGATADSLDAESKGISPRRLSRPNDRRRMGFVEAQGAGALLVCRASLAASLGLPVYGIVAYAASHSDGINASVPAPGQGILGAAAETREGEALRANACQFDARRSEIARLDAERAKLEALLGAEPAERAIAQSRAHLAHTFAQRNPAISPLRAALGVFGLSADDVAFVSKHDTSTNANDQNESKLHALLAEKLGRTPHLPLHVISQKSLTGHSKGAAAAWQLIGALQAMRDGVIPANRSLEDVAPSLQRVAPLCFSDTTVRAGSTPLRAALVTSLGFGHVGAVVCVLHPMFFWRALSARVRDEYEAKLAARTRKITARTRRVLAGIEPLYTRRTERPFVEKESSDAHHQHEAEVLLDASARRTGPRFERSTHR
jgi:3-oxoacyl-(acyl-carrier-protein) synthase